jgi:hypothetical protein
MLAALLVGSIHSQKGKKMGAALDLANRWRGKINSQKDVLEFLADGQEVLEAITNVIVSKLAPGANPYQVCVFRAFAVKMLLDSLGVNCLIQAGSASFKFRDIPSPDDGLPTHLSYESASHEHIRGMMRETSLADLEEHGMTLPEMHCWVGLLQYQTIIDTSTKYLPMMAEAAGYKWEAPPPPDILVARIDELPAAWFYNPTEQATRFVVVGLTKLYQAMGA